ncbi:hypothetical protein ACFOD9_04265 [Novosphingobium bradum]|uniref:Uncharacterized protein n=1 Tax=Novosphingobium bradum TaxID=1737444 RepID=A0ABV7ILA2_9SPHN
MNPLLGLIAPALAVLPVVLSGGGEEAGPRTAGAGDGVAAELAPVEPPVAEPRSGEPGAWRSFAQAERSLREGEPARQVRIEQRVIIRIAPGAVRGPALDPRRGLFSPFPPEARAPRTIERKIAQCLPVSAIAGVQPDGSRLLLFMRDQRIVSATLDQGCRARDYYSGFLIERTVDGMLCAGRDKLLSRSGANCGMSRLRQVVVLGDDDDE